MIVSDIESEKNSASKKKTKSPEISMKCKLETKADFSQVEMKYISTKKARLPIIFFSWLMEISHGGWTNLNT